MNASTQVGWRGLPYGTALEKLSPGYFALVMGTSIMSVGFHLTGFEVLSEVLLVIAVIAYVVLWVLFIARAAIFRAETMSDIRNPEKAFAYFTIVAGTDVLGVRLVYQGYAGVAVVLFMVGALLWFVFGYLLPWQVLMTRDGLPILARTNGTWYIWSVASQSLAIGMTALRPHFDGEARWIGIIAVMSWSVGVALYIGVSVLVALRIIHHGVTPAQFEPPYWVAMGAMAIAVVAGSNIVAMESTPMVDAVRDLVSGTVVVFWCFAAWLIPMLLGAGVWRHVLNKVPLTYVPTLWSMVFPMGMFAVASINIGRVDALPVVESIGYGALVVASVVWLIVFVAMLRGIVLMTIRQRHASAVNLAVS